MNAQLQPPAEAVELMDVYWEQLDDEQLSQELLDAFEECRGSGREWKHDDNQTAKNKLRDELMKLQCARCVYCRREIKDELGHLEIEHVLPKGAQGLAANCLLNETEFRRCTSGYLAFQYLPVNLFLSCKRCNNKKGLHDCLADRSAGTHAAYPLGPDDLIWVHPYRHRYSDHITIARGFFFRAVDDSPRGLAVINECKLDEIAAVEVKAREASVAATRSVTKALLKLAPYVDEWPDAELVRMVKEKHPGAEDAALIRAIQGIRNDDMQALAGL